MANGHGGARVGAGKKPRAERFESEIQGAEKRIADRLPSLVDRLFELAEGVTVQVVGFDGERRVYDRPPCYKAASYLVDRILGKPTQAVEAEVSGPGGGAIPLDIQAAIDKVYGEVRERPEVRESGD